MRRLVFGDIHLLVGRPVGVITDSEGVLLVANDVGSIIWRVAPDTRTN